MWSGFGLESGLSEGGKEGCIAELECRGRAREKKVCFTSALLLCMRSIWFDFGSELKR